MPVASVDSRHVACAHRLTKEVSMNTDEQAIRDLISRWHRATVAGDVDTILTLMAEDVVFLVPGKPPMRRSEFEQGLRSLLASHRIESTGEVQEVAVSENLAYCWTHLTVRMVALAGGGDAPMRTGSTLSIFRKQPSGAWVLARDANLLPSGS
jgi:uncharacterized protein (TIGR02246 family)